MEHREALVRDALSTTAGARAVADGDHGTVIRLARTALGISQRALAEQVGRAHSAISRLEKGSTVDGQALARTIGAELGIPPEALGFTSYGPHPAQPDDQEVAMLKRDLLRGAAGIAALLAFPRFLAKDTAPAQQVTAGHVAECQAALARVDAVDTRAGGEAVYELSVYLARRIQHLARTGRYTEKVGGELHAAVALGWETAGWMAYDTGQYEAARLHWLEGLHIAQVHQLHTIRVTLMADMALHASNVGWPADAINLTQAAARMPGVTPRVASLLAAREGLGHAGRRDPGAANGAFVRAARLLDKGTHPDDPPWVAFWGPDDFACHRSKAALALTDYATAERAARTALAGARTGPFARNQALYGVRVGHILARRRSLDEAIATLRPVAAAPIGSGRVRAELRTAVAVIGRHRDYRPAAEFARWAHRMVGAA